MALLSTGYGNDNLRTALSSAISMASINSTSSKASSGSQPAFWLQMGFHRDRVPLPLLSEASSMTALRELAAAFVDRKFPDRNSFQLVDKMVLFKHDTHDPNVLQIIKNPDEIVENALVEVVLSSSATFEELQIRPHMLVVHSYKTPTFCDFCGEFLFGIVRQGLKCEGCGGNYHKRCAYKIPNNCSQTKRRQSLVDVGPLVNAANGNNGNNNNNSNNGAINGSRTPQMPRRQSKDEAIQMPGALPPIAPVVPVSPMAPPPPLVAPTTPEPPGRNSRSCSWSGRPFWLEKELASRVRVPHTFVTHNYTRPTVCQYCKKLLRGLFRQGQQCKDCKFNCHKKCAPKVPKDCMGLVLSGLLHLEEAEAGDMDDSMDMMVDDDGGISGRTDDDDDDESSRSQEATPQHEFPAILPPTAPSSATSAMDEDVPPELPKKESSTRRQQSQMHQQMQQQMSQQMQQRRKEELGDGPPLTNVAEEDDDEDGNDAKNPLGQTPSTYIPLMRIVQSIKHTKQRGSNILKEGWMVHSTNGDTKRRRHFWRLDTKAVTLFVDATSRNYYKEIPLTEIGSLEQPRVSSPGIPGGGQSRPPHVFEIRITGVSPTVLCVGEDPSYGQLDHYNHAIASTESGVGFDLAKAWETALRQALMPIAASQPSSSAATPTSEDASASDASSAGGPTKTRKTGGRADKGVAEKILATKQFSVVKEEDISQLYNIFPDDILGSGQFGIVYGGVDKRTARSVAVKVIDKLRFPTKQEAQLKNEVAILQNLNHPGIVNLEQMFETPERIFVVMEKLKGDMLEMILNSPKGRLSERVTKFLIAQILVALKYLHSMCIVHCDLKPENVLLSSEDAFPQVKLCDFGYARIIGEKSFRRSIVGTPAYLPPEVLKSKGYNRSLDMWSVGVIIYVSLSGTFPFNEDEEIHDQIQNAAFMYPPNPWKEISQEAINLLSQGLLRVQRVDRQPAASCLNHPWLKQDYQLWKDLCNLEGEVGERYLTHESDDHRWGLYERQAGLTPTQTLPGRSSQQQQQQQLPSMPEGVSLSPIHISEPAEELATPTDDGK